MTTYTAKVNDTESLDKYSYGWSYILGWVAFAFAVLAAIIALIFGAPKLPRVVIEFRN